MLWGQAAGMEALGELPEGESSNSLKRRGGSGVVYPLIIATRCPLDSYTIVIPPVATVWFTS
jgi:hypothetical protein